MAAGLTREVLAKLASADFHDTADPSALVWSDHLGCECQQWDTVAGFAVRMLTGELQESVLDAEVGVVVVDLDDLTGDPSTGSGPAPGHPESIDEPIVQLHLHGELHANPDNPGSIDEPIVQLHLHGELHANPDNPEQYHVHTNGISLRSHPWMSTAHVVSLLRDAVEELTRQEAQGRGVVDPT